MPGKKLDLITHVMEKLKEMEVKKILHNCKKATYLIEKRQLESITPTDNWQLELHLSGCFGCQTYMRQSVLINDWISKVFRITDSDRRLESKFKKKLQKRIDAVLDKKKTGNFYYSRSSADPTWV